LQALLDSGADRSVFPTELAAALGYRASDLKPRAVAVGVAGTAPAFAAERPLRVRVHGFAPREVVLDPIYVRGLDGALLGRRDFFACFVVAFAEVKQAVTLLPAA
jgi:hypothetical protein